MSTGIAKKMLSVIFQTFRMGEWRNLGNAPVLGTGGAILVGSSPTSPTTTFVAGNVALEKNTAPETQQIWELVDTLVLTKSNKFWRGIYKVIHKKIVAVIVALKTKCCKVEKGMYEGFNSRALVRLRIYPPNSYIPTTAYFLAIPTSFF